MFFLKSNIIKKNVNFIRGLHITYKKNQNNFNKLKKKHLKELFEIVYDNKFL